MPAFSQQTRLISRVALHPAPQFSRARCERIGMTAHERRVEFLGGRVSRKRAGRLPRAPAQRVGLGEGVVREAIRTVRARARLARREQARRGSVFPLGVVAALLEEGEAGGGGVAVAVFEGDIDERLP